MYLCVGNGSYEKDHIYTHTHTLDAHTERKVRAREKERERETQRQRERERERETQRERERETWSPRRGISGPPPSHHPSRPVIRASSHGDGARPHHHPRMQSDATFGLWS